jgi:cytidine deaminase
MNLALSNNQDYHIVAWVQRGKTPIIGINGIGTKPEFGRSLPGGLYAFCAHAEMSAVSKAKDIKKSDVLHVMRFTKTGRITMAKPCKHCQSYLKKKGIRRVMYTDWDGSWNKMKIS